MVEELKLAIKVDDDSIEQSLLKQFANAQKMADKVVLDFKNVNFDDKEIEAKFKALQKKAGQNPIDLSINKDSIQMLSQISDKLGDIFKIAQGKSIIDSSSIAKDIGKVAQATNTQANAIDKVTSSYKNQAYELASVLKMLAKLDKYSDVPYADAMSRAVKSSAKSYKNGNAIQFTAKQYGMDEEDLKYLRGLSVNLSNAFNYTDTFGLDTANISDVEKLTAYFRELLKEKLEFNNTKLNTSDIEELIKALGILKKEHIDDGTKSGRNVYGDAYLDKYSNLDMIKNYLKEQEKQALATAEAEQKLAEVQKETVPNTSNSNNSQIEELKTDIQEVKTELGDVKDRLTSIESNGFENVREDVEKTKESVKELNSELTEMKTNISSSTSAETNISSGNSSTASAEKFQQITSDTVNVLSDVGKTEDQIIQKIQKERSEAEANNEVLREHLVLLDKAGKVVANHWGSTSNVNGTYTDEQLSQAQGGKIIHAHPGKASFFGGQDLKHLLQDSMYDQIKQIDLIWGDSALSVDKSTLTKESSGTLLNIMRNVRKTLTEAYGDNPDGAPSQEAREHINAIEKEIFKTIAQKLNVSVSEEGNMAKEVTDALSDVDKSIIKRFSEIKDSVIKDTDASSIIKNQMKDAFQGNDEITSSSEKVSNAVKEENNILEQNTQKAKENAEAKEKMANADKEVSNANFSKYDNRLESYNKKTSGYDATIARFEDGGWTSDAYLKNVQAVKDAVAEYERILNNLKAHPELVTEEGLNDLAKQEKLIKENITAVQNMSAAEKGFTLLSGQKAMDKINSILKENSAMSREAKNQIRAWYNEIASGNPSKNLSQILGEVQKIVNAEAEAGRAGKSMMDSIKEKAWYGVASAIGTYFGFNDILRYGGEVVDIVTDLNTQITELAKVSEQSSKQIYADFDSYADIAKEVRGTISDTIAATADWSKNGYSIPDSKELAEISQLYKNVGDGINIDEANESLISTLKGFKLEADQAEHIVDVFNEVSNNEAISSAGIGDALQRSAASFNAANTSLEQSVALVTATNSVLQDPEKVGKQIIAYLYSNVMKIKVAISVKLLRRTRPRKDYNICFNYRILRDCNTLYGNI